MSRMDGLRSIHFQGFDMNNIPFVEDLLLLHVFLYDIDNVEGTIIGVLARPTVEKHENTVRLLRYNIHKCYLSRISAVFQ